MRAGALDRRITIEEPTDAEDNFGGEVKTWIPFATVWSARADMKGRERFNSDQIQAQEVTTWRIRYLEGLKPTMRIVYGNKIYEIKGIAELGRHVGLEITTEAMDVSNA